MMRYLAALIAGVVVLAGCGAGTPAATGTSTAGAMSLGPSAVTAPSAGPTATASTAAFSARVTFDGTRCVYEGPAVMTSPSSLALTYAPTPAQEGTSLMHMNVKADTTPAVIAKTVADPNAPKVGEGAPDWVLVDSWNNQLGSGTFTWDVQVWRVGGVVYDRYYIACLPTFPGYPVGDYALIQLIEPAASPSP